MQQWFIDFAERIDDGDPIYLACEECGTTALPPRSVCPECGTRTFEERSLSETATVTASTTIFSSIPAYADETPYTVVVATFDEGVRLTGQLRDADSVEPGETVTVDAEERDDGWLVTFSPTG
ncbi:OB-fold domain-containing protein [Natronolimnohabitans sp. A-GB9]|uniref:Zn-ribbon domain-containing OB-fold protein n=1 Tax=Natronolimnohabitans sp. A-GB9 TaxID=3069757 RepID=UPI0027B53767|nr:OB-fold domain-containing protein [Natronolimnohabitans sp. A-GB9]MDQ2052425.1 OB-fold domain-containing protein [Natronolimnohabitans sp. A-GB9]